MNNYNYEEIKRKEELIEANRLAIKELKKEKFKLHSKMDMSGNIYEYLASPLCAISITLSALFTGPVVYILPITMTGVAINMIAYKYSIRKKIDKLNNKMQSLKKERQNAYQERERAYENIFNSLHAQKLDDKDYYHQIIAASEACEELTESMQPYKEKKSKLEKIKNRISRIFDYVLAPLATVVLPVFAAVFNMSLVWQIVMMTISSAALLGCVLVDDNLTQKVDDLAKTINEIKSDRTVKYVQRDLKLKESLEYLKIKDSEFKKNQSRIPQVINVMKENIDNKIKRY